VQRSGPTTYTTSRGDFDRVNRDRYVTRTEHHTYDWYRNNGWNYDPDYWHRYHRHRYFNDSLGLVIFDSAGPYLDPYAYDYVEPSVVYTEPEVMDYSVDLSVDTLLAVQDVLARAGYYAGPIDGIIGPGTRAAIIAYQEDFGLPVTGHVDTPLLQSMRLMQ